MARIVFIGTGRSIEAPPRTSLLAAVQRAGLPLARACGGRGICDSCALRIHAGGARIDVETPPGDVPPMQLAPGWTMACLARIGHDALSHAHIRLWSPAWSEDPYSGPGPTKPDLDRG